MDDPTNNDRYENIMGHITKPAHNYNNNSKNIRRTKSELLKSGSFVANLLLSLVGIVLTIYDIISMPIYFLIQRPDRRAREVQRSRSERVDVNTWIKTDQGPNETSHLLHKSWLIPSNSSKRLGHTFLGTTMSEIFANAIKEFSSRPCLGYRAVVTCPVIEISSNEKCDESLRKESFRSNYTWYSYEQIGHRVQDIASGLYHYSVYPGNRVMFMASTSIEWFCAAQACLQLNAQLVVAPEMDDIRTLKLILQEAEVNIVFVSCDRLNQLCQLFDSIKTNSEDNYHIKKVVLIDWLFSVDFNEPAFEALRRSSERLVEQVLSMGQIEEIGVENPIELRCTRSLCNEQPDDALGMNKTYYTSNIKLGASSTAATKSPFPRRHSLFEPATKSTNFKTPPGYQLQNSTQTTTKNHKSCAMNCDNGTTVSKFSSSKAKPTDLAMIVYTIGPIGQPKAVMLSHSYLARCNHYLFLDGMVQGSDVHCSTLALENIIEFMTEMCIFSHGGSIGYSCSPNTLFYDGKELFDRDRSDLEALKPTFLLVKPYILERLRTSIQNYLSEHSNSLMSLIQRFVLYDYKKFWAQRHMKTPIVDYVFCSGLERLFGGNLRFVLCNGATDCSETKDFFTFMLNIPVIELYGPNEAIVSLISVSDIWDHERQKWAQDDDDDDETLYDYDDIQLMFPKVNRNIFKEDSSKNLLTTSSIYCPTLGTRIRLEDWEDFRTSDRPCPRGRLVIGGDVVCMGHLKRPREMVTSGPFYTDSNFITWLRTNDIARVFPNGSFEIISGLMDMIKMVDGQFISLSQIEHLLRNSQFVENVCALCGENRKFIIALVVPNLRRLALKSPNATNLKMAIGNEPEPEELCDIEFRREVCNDRLFSEFVNEHLSDMMTKAGIQSTPKRFHLVPEIWTPETELVTSAFEPKRNAIQKFYATDIQSIVETEFSFTRNRLSARLGKRRDQCGLNRSGATQTYLGYKNRSSH